MSQRISKRKIKGYILWREAELGRLEREGKIYQAENDKEDHQIYDLTEHYLNEERIRGEIAAARYILKNCYGKINMKEKCKKCQYKQYYGKDIFPCTKCDTEPPVTCLDCKYALFERCKKGIRLCEKFEWW